MTTPVRRANLPPPAAAHPVPAPAQARLKVAFVLIPRFTLTAFAGFVDCLRLAADEADKSRPIDCWWTLLGDTGKPVTSSCGVEITPWQAFGDPAQFDYVVVVGGLLHGGQQSGARADSFLKLAAARGVPLIGLCTGSFVLARTGLMEGYRCCVSWFHHHDFTREFPGLKVVSDELFVVDRDRMTCAGGTSVPHLAAHLIGKHCSKVSANKSLRILIEENALPSRTSQPPPILERPASDPLVRRAVLLMEQSLSNRPSVEKMAASLNLSVRQLERRFQADIGMSPQALALHLRLGQSRWLVEHTTRPVTDIALECGFSDCAHFSRMFRRAFGCPPTGLRCR